MMHWKYRKDTIPALPDNWESWAGRLEVSPLLLRFLLYRGLREPEQLTHFLNPCLQGLAPLEAWPGLMEAAEILTQGLLEGKKLCVWGDYDVDGITATTLVLEFLAEHGFSAMHHIPDRLDEGYGLNSEGIIALARQGASLLLTVDCGISDNEVVAQAKSLGMTVVISDHHLPATALPPADIVVNPRISPCPCPALAGVGVAFLLMAAVNRQLQKAGYTRVDMRRFLDLVALGTLADVVDINGQNRILVKNGLLKIAEGSRVGIAALKTACNFSPTASIGARQVVFALAPRINAAGRLGSNKTALDLLLTKDRGNAADLAATLSRLNATRREQEEIILREAMTQAEEQANAGRLGLVLHAPSWHPGIIGIVASRVVERLHRPTVVLSTTGHFLKGSGRSVPGFDVHAAFVASEELLLGYGGHKMAAGLSLLPEQLAAFSDRFNVLAVSGLGGVQASAECRIDSDLSFAEVDFYFLKELEMVQPFGMGNPEPVFASPPVRVKNIRNRAGCLLLDLEEEACGRTLTAKAWRHLADIPRALKGRYICIAYTPCIDRYNGVASIELRLKDWQEVPPPAPLGET